MAINSTSENPSSTVSPRRAVDSAVQVGVMLLVPDITAGTGTEFEEMLVCDGSGGLSQSEGAQERVLSVDEFLSEWDCGVR